MEEKIIVANGVSETELLRTLAKNGQNTFGVRVMSTYELALEALLQLSLGVDKDFVASSNEAALVFKAIGSTNYFSKVNYEDAIEMFKALDDLRLYIESDEEDFFKSFKGTDASSKNYNLSLIYEAYIKYLTENNKIDTIGIIRFAIDNYKNDSEKLAQKLIILDEFPLKPLEMTLVKALSNDIFESISLSNTKEVKIEKYTRAFGIRNEIEDILNTIKVNNYKLDECTIVLLETTLYPQIIEDYFAEFNIPFTSGLGTSFIESNTGRLFNLIIDWLKNYSGRDYFLKIVKDVSFDKEKLLAKIDFNEDNFTDKNRWYFETPTEYLFKAVGNLRINFDARENNKKIAACETLLIVDDEEKLIYTFVRKIIEEFNKGISYIIKNYVKPNPIHNENGIISQIETLFNLMNGYDLPFDEIVKVCGKIQSSGIQSKNGAIHITTLGKALCSIRPNMFIVGLSGSNFPGSPRENAFILDKDYPLDEKQKMSEMIITEKKVLFNNLLHLCCNFDSKVYLSYSSYNEATLKAQNSSSVIFETFQNERGKHLVLSDLDDRFKGKVTDLQVRSVSFFDAPLNKNDKLGKTYVNRINVKTEDDIDENGVAFKKHTVINKNLKGDQGNSVPVSNQTINKKLNSLYLKRYSATAICNFRDCEYKFYLKNVLGLDDSSETDEFQIIPGNDLGTLIHAVLEDFDKTKMSKDDLVNKGIEEFNKYIIFHIPANAKTVDDIREDIKVILGNAYDLLGNEKTLLKEKDINTQFENTGIKVHGLPDKVIETEKGHCVVLDYKIKNHVEHDEDDPSTLIQIALYAYLFKKLDKGRHIIDEGKFLYLKQGREIKVDINASTTALTAIIERMKVCFDSGVFLANGTDDVGCKYCKFGAICGKYKEK